MNRKRILLWLLGIFCCYLRVQAQNLITNGSFEYTNGAISTYPEDDFQILTNVFGEGSPELWYTPKKYKTYYRVWTNSHSWPVYNCVEQTSNDNLFVPSNWGHGYVGIQTYPVKEYISFGLNTPLTAGECYTVSFAVRTGHDLFFFHHKYIKPRANLSFPISRWWRGYRSNNVGVLLSQGMPSRSIFANAISDPFVGTPQYNITSLIDGSGWEIHTFDYQAIGGEQVITIGNFFSNANTQLSPQDYTWKPCEIYPYDNKVYHLIDNISVFKKRDMVHYVENQNEPNTAYTLSEPKIIAGEDVDPSSINGPVVVPASSSNREYIADYSIDFQPGFSANGIFNAYILPTCDEEVLSISEPPTEKHENLPPFDISEGNNHTVDEQINLHPNPFADYFEVQIAPNSDLLGIKVIDLQGKLVFETEQFDGSNLLRIQTSEWPQGTYIIQMQSATGIKTGRMVKN